MLSACNSPTSESAIQNTTNPNMPDKETVITDLDKSEIKIENAEIIIDGDGTDWSQYQGSLLGMDYQNDVLGGNDDLGTVYALRDDNALFLMVELYSRKAIKYLRLQFNFETKNNQKIRLDYNEDGDHFLVTLDGSHKEISLEQSLGSVIEIKLPLEEFKDIPVSILSVSLQHKYQKDSYICVDEITNLLEIPTTTEAMQPQRIKASTDQIKTNSKLIPATEVWHANIHDENCTPADFAYRSNTLVSPSALAIGPDDQLYVADKEGRQLLVVSHNGEIEKIHLDTWKFMGPGDLEFDSTGTLFVSTNANIYRFEPDGSAISLDISDGFPRGGIAINSEDELYFADRDNSKIYHLQQFGAAVMVAENLDHPVYPEFGPDGRLYFAHWNGQTISVLDLETGAVSTFFEDSSAVNLSGGFTFDKDGNLWVHGERYLNRIGPDGKDVPFKVNGATYEGDYLALEVGLNTGGISMDKEGNLWLGVYEGNLSKFNLQDDGSFQLERIITGYHATGLVLGSDNALYTYNDMAKELWKIDLETKKYDVYFEPGEFRGNILMAMDDERNLYLAYEGELKILDTSGNLSTITRADIVSMTVGSDGNLYAMIREANKNIILSLISRDGKITELADTKLDTDLEISSCKDGLYILARRESKIFFHGYGGGTELEEKFVLERGSNPFFSNIIVSPQCDLYVFAYDLFRFRDDGSWEYLIRVQSDPRYATTSLDGDVLIIAENGAIQMIDVPALEQ